MGPPDAASAEPGFVPDESWRPDILEGFERRDLPLTADPAEGEPEGPLHGTLVRRGDPGRRSSDRAVLYLHGWNDYFFQTHVAEFFEARGFAFYALDLRRYGRSLREGQYWGYVDSLDDYAEELDAAADIIGASHGSLLLVGHSTGGLVAATWAAARPGRLAGLVLNSPWLDMFGPPVLTAAVKALVGSLSRRKATSVLKLPPGSPVYARTIHASHGGEWDYSLELKSPDPVPIRVGWLRAILRAQAAVTKGLAIDCPVLVATSSTSLFRTRWSERAREADVVLDVARITAAAWHLGDHVTIVRIPGGLHDLALSSERVRRRYFDEIARWLDAYVVEPEEAGEVPPPPVVREADDPVPGVQVASASAPDAARAAAAP